jgi:hypothetical protein
MDWKTLSDPLYFITAAQTRLLSIKSSAARTYNLFLFFLKKNNVANNIFDEK